MEKKELKVVCPICHQTTRHDVLAEIKSSGSENQIDWWVTCQIIQCRGCEEVSFRKVNVCSEDFDPETDGLLERESLYPSRAIPRKPIAEFYHFPEQISHIYREVLKAIDNDALILAAIGLRAVVEAICIDQSTTGLNLKERIHQLAAQGLLSQRQADILHMFRFMGNIAAHEIKSPSLKDLLVALDIAETLLKTIYILPHRVKFIRL
jgi:hypothetical protein